MNGLVGSGGLYIGHPMQVYYGYQTDGVFLDADDVKTWADQTKVTPKAQVGDIRYKDINGPDGVPDGKVDPNYDRVVLGTRIPKYTFGLDIQIIVICFILRFLLTQPFSDYWQSFRGYDNSIRIQNVVDAEVARANHQYVLNVVCRTHQF